MKINRPQVLLLGNGLNRAYGSASWTEFLCKIAARDDLIQYLKQGQSLESPMPLQAILLTNNHIDEKLSENNQEAFGSVANGQLSTLQKLLTLGFDHILTTNYSYELELAAFGGKKITEKQISALQHFYKVGSMKGAQTRYLINTYNLIDFQGQRNMVWHIHGEARKPNSMVLGHYFYGNLLFRIINYTKKYCDDFQKKQRKNQNIPLNSWIDSFILGDVYIVGYGLDWSELDLWWLINRKANEKAEHGDIHFYNPISDKHEGLDEHLELVKIFVGKNGGVHDMGISIPTEKDEQNAAYIQFYNKAIEDISLRVANARKGENVNG